MLKEAVVIKFEMLSWHWSGETEKSHDRFHCDLSPGWDSNPKPPNYETKMLQFGCWFFFALRKTSFVTHFCHTRFLCIVRVADRPLSAARGGWRPGHSMASHRLKITYIAIKDKVTFLLLSVFEHANLCFVRPDILRALDTRRPKPTGRNLISFNLLKTKRNLLYIWKSVLTAQ